MNEDSTNLGQVIRIDDERVRDYLRSVVRGSVEETLNALLEAEAEQLCKAQRYERTEARRDTRAGSYRRKLGTQAGEVTLKVPKLRQQTFETAIIERYRRRESSVEEALIEMYLAGVSVRRIEDITEALWGTRVSPATVSNLNKKIYGTIEAWRNRAISGEHPYVYLDGIVLKRTWAGEVRNVSLLVATSVNGEGYREILGIVEGAKEDKAGWLSFLKHLKDRGLAGVRLIISDACLGLVEAAAEVFADARWQRCVVHWYRNAFVHVPRAKMAEVALMLKAIHASESRQGAEATAGRVRARLEDMKLSSWRSGLPPGWPDAELSRFPVCALATHSHEQRARAAAARDSAAHAGCGRVPGWAKCAQPGSGSSALRCRLRMVDATLSQHGPAQGGGRCRGMT